VRPLKNEDASPMKPDSDLKTEVRSTKPVAEPTEAVRYTVLPLKKDDANPSEPDSILNTEE